MASVGRSILMMS